MAQTRASVAAHLPIWGSATRQQVDAMSTPFVGPSTMDCAPDVHYRSPKVSLTSRGPSSHASDNARPQAQNLWEDTLSNDNMSFNPDAYGNPKARQRFGSTNEDPYQPDQHPGWGLPIQRPFDQQSSWASPAQHGVALQDRGEEHMSHEAQIKEVTSLEAEPTKTQNWATNAEERLPTRSITPPAVKSVSTHLPLFDRTAYGDPSTKSPSGTTQRIPAHKVSTGYGTLRQNITVREARVNPSQSQVKPPSSNPQPYFPEPAFNISANTFDTIQYTTPPTRPSSQQQVNATTGRMDSAPKSRVISQSATYDSLKQGSETPEQLIARMRNSQQIEIAQRIKRQDRGEIITTTALTHLDFLRKPLSAASDEPQLDIRNPPTKPQPLSNIDPNLPRNLSLPGGFQHTDHNYLSESKQERKEVYRLAQAKKDRVLGVETATPIQQDNNMASGSYQPTDRSLQGAVSQKVVDKSHTTAVQPTNMVATQNKNAAQPSKPGTELSKNGSHSVSATGWISRQNRINAVPKTSRWATAADMKAPRVKTDSNAEGSEESESDADSLTPMVVGGIGLGRLISSRVPLVPEERLVGWDGQIQPPPADWEIRPQFYNNTPDYISGFENWLGQVTVQKMSEKSVAELSFSVIPPEQVSNLDNHPDGIGFTRRDTMLDPSNAELYGHRLATPLRTDCPLDYDGDAKLDLSDPENVRYKDETAEIFISKHMAHIKRVQQEAEEKLRLQRAAERQQKLEADLMEQQAAAGAAAAELEEAKQAATATSSKNIYLRPAVEADAPNMMAILNWHIANSIRPTELGPITEDDMLDRITMSQHARLPFIVAIERTRKSSRSRARKGPRVRPDHPIQNIDPEYIGVTRDEPIVGWASATDWSASNYVETTTVELELYVAAAHRKFGVGKCLMDAILEATDRGYNRKGNYDFRVAPEMKHMYVCGGGRDLNKLIFQVRSYNKPVSPEQEERILRASVIAESTPGPARPPRRGRPNYGNLQQSATAAASIERQFPKKDFSKAARLDDREDDYELWLKEWLESYGFEEEAHLKKMGTKQSRFVDLRYLVKETCWQPREGRIPDYANGY